MMVHERQGRHDPSSRLDLTVLPFFFSTLNLQNQYFLFSSPQRGRSTAMEHPQSMYGYDVSCPGRHCPARSYHHPRSLPALPDLDVTLLPSWPGRFATCRTLS